MILKVLVPAFVILLVCYAAIGIKMLVRKDGRFEKKCCGKCTGKCHKQKSEVRRKN